MNGFSAHGLDEDAFAEKSSLKGGLQTFDAFRKSFSFDLGNWTEIPTIFFRKY